MKRTRVTLVDDIDGSDAAETVHFALDGATYEIDLSEGNAERMRQVLAPFTAAGMKVGRGGIPRQRVDSRLLNGRRSGPGHGGGGVPANLPSRQENAKIRIWAGNHGIHVAPMGRIKQEIVDQYRAAMAGLAEKSNGVTVSGDGGVIADPPNGVLRNVADPFKAGQR